VRRGPRLASFGRHACPGNASTMESRRARPQRSDERRAELIPRGLPRDEPDVQGLEIAHTKRRMRRLSA